jgi:tripartite-type tricarboxylate transporter receptor subunit TctC
MKKILIGLIALFCTSVFAWEPTKPVNVIFAYAPGSGNEILFRKMESIINKDSKKINFIFEHRPGANEVVGSNVFAKSKNDGYTLFVPGLGVWVANPIWHKNVLLQDPTEWEPVISLGEAPLALYASMKSQTNTLDDFYNNLKAGKTITIGSGAPTMHLAYEYINRQVIPNNSQVVHFNSPPQVAQAVAGDQIEFGITPISFAMELAKVGRLKIIAVTGQNKVNNYPNLAEKFKGLSLIGEVGIVLPKGTSKEVSDYYKAVFTEAINSDEYKNFLKEINWYDSLNTPNNYKKFLDTQRKTWLPVAESIPVNN